MFYRCLCAMGILFAGIGTSLAQDCAQADNLTWVKGGSECLAIATYGSPPDTEQPTLLVFIHGDKSRGGPLTWEQAYVELFAGNGVIGVTLARPGYPMENGRQSTGDTNGRKDSYTEDNIHAVAMAIEALKAHHNADRLIVVGYSGGAAYTGVMLGKYPQLVQDAVLLANPSDIPRWRRANKWKRWYRSLSPHDFIDGVSPTARVIAVTGDRDKNTRAELAEDYVAELKDRGINAEFRFAPGATHNTVPSSEAAIQAIRDILNEKRG